VLPIFRQTFREARMQLTFYRPLAIGAIVLLTLGASVGNRLCAATGPNDNSFDSRHWREAQSCGVACGYMLARLLGEHVDYKTAVAAIPIEDGGTSLLQLQDGLRVMGVSAVILRAKPQDLDCMAMPVIAHMLPRRETSNSVGHFLLVLHIDDHSVRYIEPNYAASIETVPRNRFLRCWSGYLITPSPRKNFFERCLAFALWGAFATSITSGAFAGIRYFVGRVRSGRKCRRVAFVASLIAASGLAPGCAELRPTLNSTLNMSERQAGADDLSRLVVWNTDADLGALPQDGAAEALFRIENQGNAEVRLRLGSPTCRCSEASIEKQVLKPGESTNVHMVMHSRPGQAGPADARVYVEADRGKWAEMLSVHAVELGANFPDYTYVIGGTPPASRSASFVGNVFLKAPTTVPKVDVPLVGTPLESILAIHDVRVGPPIEVGPCVRRECSFTIQLKSTTSVVDDRREVAIPISITADGETTTRFIRLTVLPTGRSVASQARRSP
jgi:hypothetical protein